MSLHHETDPTGFDPPLFRHQPVILFLPEPLQGAGSTSPSEASTSWLGWGYLEADQSAPDP